MGRARLIRSLVVEMCIPGRLSLMEIGQMLRYLHIISNSIVLVLVSYYNKRNAHFDVQELLLHFWTERRETWQEYGDA